jgi:hypothetical protein
MTGFGSDWPTGNAVDHLDVVVKIVRDYFATPSAVGVAL